MCGCRNCQKPAPLGWTLCRDCLDLQDAEKAYYHDARHGAVSRSHSCLGGIGWRLLAGLGLGLALLAIVVVAVLRA